MNHLQKITRKSWKIPTLYYILILYIYIFLHPVNLFHINKGNEPWNMSYGEVMFYSRGREIMSLALSTVPAYFICEFQTESIWINVLYLEHLFRETISALYWNKGSNCHSFYFAMRRNTTLLLNYLRVFLDLSCRINYFYLTLI